MTVPFDQWQSYRARAADARVQKALSKPSSVNGEFKEPRVSVITVVYNGERTIEATIRSVLAQTYKNIEYIVIDGGSSDATMDIVRSLESGLAFWSSARDNGIYDAMNLGLTLSSGSIVGLLNADDWLAPDAIAKIVAGFTSDDIDFVYADAFIVDLEGQLIGKKMAEPNLAAALPYRMPFAHQTLYVRRRVLEKLGPYDTAYRLSADLDFVCRLVGKGFNGHYIREPFSFFREGGASGGLRTFRETRRVAVAHGMSPVRSWLCMLSSIVKMSMARWLPSGCVRMIRRLKGSRYVEADA